MKYREWNVKSRLKMDAQAMYAEYVKVTQGEGVDVRS